MYYFLDIDGVLNRESDWIRPFSINEQCLKSFKSLIAKDMEPHIILSSTWRAGCTNSGAKMTGDNNTSNIFMKYGIYIEDSTPVSNKSRQEEIEYYIRRYYISDYIVLDDDESLFPWPKRINLYLTNYKTGLTLQDIKIIKGKHKF